MNGSNGNDGARGSLWFTGSNDPTNSIPNIQNQDMYFETSNNTIWQFSSLSNNWYEISNLSPYNNSIFTQLDGGSAVSIYLNTDNIDGGSAASTYITTETVDGGGA
jgi:hypothetical protein